MARPTEGRLTGARSGAASLRTRIVAPGQISQERLLGHLVDIGERANQPGRPAETSVRGELAGDGVQVVLRPAIHANAMVIDGRLALVGSQNRTMKALDSNREESVLLANPVALSRLDATFRLDWPVPAR